MDVATAAEELDTIGAHNNSKLTLIMLNYPKEWHTTFSQY